MIISNSNKMQSKTNLYNNIISIIIMILLEGAFLSLIKSGLFTWLNMCKMAAKDGFEYGD